MRVLCALLTLSFLISTITMVKASVISVSPTRLYVSPDSKTTSFKLKNNGDEKALIEVQVHSWTDGDDRNALEPTKDFLIAPPIFEIGPDEDQILRIVPRTKGELDKERMYRLVITEVAAQIGPANGVGFSVEMSLPIFLAPEGAVAKPVWSFDWKDVKTPELIVVNQGNAHTRVRSIQLFDDPDGEPIFKSGDAAYIFSGEKKRWPLEGSFAAFKGPITVKAETTKGPIEALIPLPEG